MKTDTFLTSSFRTFAASVQNYDISCILPSHTVLNKDVGGSC